METRTLFVRMITKLMECSIVVLSALGTLIALILEVLRIPNGYTLTLLVYTLANKMPDRCFLYLGQL